MNAANPPLKSSVRARIAGGYEKSIAWVAMLWGTCIAMPVGTQYLCLLLLLVLMTVSGRFKDAVVLFREERFFAFAVAAFLSVTLLTLATQDTYYRETLSNIWHGVRIVLTIIVGLNLLPSEAKLALKGGAASLTLMSAWVVASHFELLTGAPKYLLDLLPVGNEWISMSILLVVLLMACLRFPYARRTWWGFWPAVLGVFSIAMNLWVMNQRTAILGIFVGMVCLVLARWRGRLPVLIASILSIAVLCGALIQSVDSVNAKFKTGFNELTSAQGGTVNTASMNIRYHMYTQTINMILDRPWRGWGVGSWNDQWKKRVDPSLHASNMPHNDFLWMGAQSGWPGAFAWLWLMLSLCWIAWKKRHAVGHVAFAAASVALVSSLVNSGTRDASIGLPLLFIVSAILAWARSSDVSDAD